MSLETEALPERLQKMMEAFKLLRECGNYDTSISGAVGEVYAEDVLGMDKSERGMDGIDGWINGRSVQVKTKEIRDNWCEKPLSSRFVQIREGKQNNVDDLIVIMVHPTSVWTHYYGALSALEARPSKGVVRYHLHRMNGEGLVNYDRYIAELFSNISKVRRRVSQKHLVSDNHAADSDRPSIKLNRLTIRKAWIGKGILLDIRDQKSGNLFRLPHDELIDIISKCSPAALKSKSWTHGELYSWPSISKLVLNELKERGFSGQK